MNKIQEYSQELLDLISEYDKPTFQRWVTNNYFIESMVFIHRHLSAQLRYLLIKNYNRSPTKLTCIKFVEVIDRLDDIHINKFAYLLKIIDKVDLGNLNSLNTMRNKFVHPSEKRNDYTDTQIRSILQNAVDIEKKLKINIP